MASTSSPCAGCKYLRRKCTPECVFAPYFPPDQPQKFAIVHKIFGASNASKLLHDLPLSQREDAANSLAYEADARVKDPVYGCVGAISYLERQVAKLKQELVEAKTELSRFGTSPAASATILVAEPSMPMAVSALQGSSSSTSSLHGISMGLTLQQQQQQQMLPTTSRVDHQQAIMYGHITREQHQAQILAREKQMLELQLDSHNQQQQQQQCFSFPLQNYHHQQQQDQLTREHIMEQLQLARGGGGGGGISYELGPTSLSPASVSEQQFRQIAFNPLWSSRSGSDDSGPSCKAGVSPLSPA